MRAVLCFLLFMGGTFGLSVTACSETSETVETMEGVMPISDFFGDLEGKWSGTYSLWLHPGAEEEKSSTAAEISNAANGAYFTMTYDWVWRDKPQAGVFLFGGTADNVRATWGDSWHQQPQPMHCKGTISLDGERLTLMGYYAAGEGPDWGWRTEFTKYDDGSFGMEVFNITPEGEEAQAVLAKYQRQD